ncbi:hypothetical protein CR513_49872, partial [Mucuna pruriens]
MNFVCQSQGVSNGYPWIVRLTNNLSILEHTSRRSFGMVCRSFPIRNLVGFHSKGDHPVILKEF